MNHLGAHATEDDPPRTWEAFSERFKPKFKVLKDDVEHHAEEEEEGKMFPKIRKLIKEEELKQLGEELEAAKHKRFRKAS